MRDDRHRDLYMLVGKAAGRAELFAPAVFLAAAPLAGRAAFALAARA